ncbi:MAG: hypothetical protein RIA62_06410 [Cyclobacteriaceae bacterium]
MRACDHHQTVPIAIDDYFNAFGSPVYGMAIGTHCQTPSFVRLLLAGWWWYPQRPAGDSANNKLSAD